MLDPIPALTVEPWQTGLISEVELGVGKAAGLAVAMLAVSLAETTANNNYLHSLLHMCMQLKVPPPCDTSLCMLMDHT